MIKSHKLSRAFVLSIWLSETNSHRSSWATCTPMAMSPLMAKLPHRGPAPSLLGHHLQASFLRTRPCDELRIGTLLHSPVDGRDEQLHLSHAHRALETTFSQPAMLLALRLHFLVGFILRLLVCFDLGSSLLVCFYSWPPRACRRGRGMPLPFCRTNASSSSCTNPPCPAQDPPLPPAACLCRVPAPTGPEAKRQG